MTVVHRFPVDVSESQTTSLMSKIYPGAALFDSSPAEQRWATALIRFNMEPALYAHHSWLPAWSSGASKQGSSHLSAELLQTYNLASIFDWQMAVPASRFFMMDKATLERVALVTGIAAHRNRLRQIVLKSHLEVLRAGLGDAIDTLWMPFAESLPLSPSRLIIQWDPFEVDDLKVDLCNAGYFHLLQLVELCEPVQHAAAMRAAFCAPKEIAALVRPALNEGQVSRSSNTIINEVIPHWAPAWTWLF